MTRRRIHQISLSPTGTPKARKSLGQNFLVDRSVIQRIIALFDPAKDDTVLEIGPGHGALTEKLIGLAGKLYALEFDRSLIPLLRDSFAGNDNFVLLEEDALAFDFATLREGDKPLRLIANLPYNISTAILQRLFDYPGLFKDCVLMFQREVARRIMAPPGTKDRGYISVMTELYFSADALFDVPPGAFRPVPKVWSSVIRLTSLQPPNRSNTLFGRVVAAGFAQKRKTLGNNLKRDFSNYLAALSAATIDATRRAESLTLDEWLRLSEAIASGE
jgi:16S rRNA (adenine1518-N6/adenine1519-N6)-dimethyltransferase